MRVVELRNLVRVYRRKVKQPGLRGTFRALFNRRNRGVCWPQPRWEKTCWRPLLHFGRGPRPWPHPLEKRKGLSPKDHLGAKRPGSLGGGSLGPQRPRWPPFCEGPLRCSFPGISGQGARACRTFGAGRTRAGPSEATFPRAEDAGRAFGSFTLAAQGPPPGRAHPGVRHPFPTGHPRILEGVRGPHGKCLPCHLSLHAGH